jgi:error-prone DNA polymerase
MSRWFLGPPAWKDLEAVLSDRPVPVTPNVEVIHTGAVEGEDGEPAFTPSIDVPYAELHAHSHFSFLDGASSP